MSKAYEIVIFSSSKSQYVDQVINQIDPKSRISHVLSRDDCTVINNEYFIKPLNALGRKINDVILVDVKNINYHRIIGWQEF